ncbi:Vid27p [Sugiyamaella lignohabitans]|uniref:Vid27p n=1 Tax=Sugiyamaella lignohabitans TaxID=796027 RepID=A0A161HNA4_9ASCO|nr:Vid27p [Sugiyamaella lignohabitans]ANB15587.1 Vid27p [Sugiyamaella lignohabitans]
MNFLRKLLATSPKEELAVIPAGQLFLARLPSTPKGVHECIFKDAVMSIRRTSNDYHYQLVVQRVYEEGEESLADNDEDGSELDENKDEWAFLVDEALQISYFSEQDGRVVVSWLDTSGEPGDRFEFICDANTKPNVFDHFDQTAKICQYERKYQVPFEGDPETDLTEFDFEVEAPSQTEEPVQLAGEPLQETQDSKLGSSTLESPSTPTRQKGPGSLDNTGRPSTTEITANTQQTSAKHLSATESSLTTKGPQTPAKQKEPEPPQKTVKPPIEGTLISSHKASFHLFDPVTSSFVEQNESVDVRIVEIGKFEYLIEARSGDDSLLAVAVDPDLNPCFNFEHLSFIFNYFTESSVFSFLFKFDDFNLLSEFQQSFMIAMWETSNKQKWSSIGDNDHKFMTEQFEEMAIDEKEDDEEEDSETEEDSSKGFSKPADYDEDEEYDKEERFEAEGKNSQLAVGMTNDRSYVVRGNKIGVFKQTANNDLEFTTSIDNIGTSNGKSFSPKKVMLHTQDRSLVLQDPDSLSKLFRMDLEYGKVIDEWTVDENTSVRSFEPSKKFSQTTGEQTFLGISDNGLFRIDPRLSGDKLVQSEHKKYATKNNMFNVLTTTEGGHIAVATQKGDIRLYDRLGVNAKTQLPAFGDAIIGIDASPDGRWILATCKTYLLLIDAEIKEGKYEGTTGFMRSFGKDSKPRPKRLQISPQHVAFMQGETGKPLSFTKAYFNTGHDAKVQTVVTSSGPYVITWSLKKIWRGDREPYLIKRYESNVTADNFKFGTDKNVIISLEDDVGMVSRSTFRKPTRESLATPARRVQALSRNSIVNSPF